MSHNYWNILTKIRFQTILNYSTLFNTFYFLSMLMLIVNEQAQHAFKSLWNKKPFKWDCKSRTLLLSHNVVLYNVISNEAHTFMHIWYTGVGFVFVMYCLALDELFNHPFIFLFISVLSGMNNRDKSLKGEVGCHCLCCCLQPKGCSVTGTFDWLSCGGTMGLSKKDRRKQRKAFQKYLDIFFSHYDGREQKVNLSCNLMAAAGTLWWCHEEEQPGIL